jgi:MHS family proline/betaine transporter-like MFS transporter
MIILFSQYKWLLTKASLLACVGGIYYSSFFVFLITYLNVFVGLPMASVLWLNALCLLSSGGFIFYFAQCADRYGRHPVLLLSSLSLALLIYPAFILLNTGNFWLCLLGVWLLTTANTAFMAACSTVYVELFPSEVKYTGCAIAYNIGAGIIGGFVPFFLTFLLHHWGPWLMAGVLTLSAMAAVCLIYFWIPETLTAEEVKITVE